MYTANKLINLIFYRFGIYEYGIKKILTDFAKDEHTVGLYEEALQLIILLSTELPLPPLTPTERATVLLRRELVHKLVSGPCTFSQLQECLSIVPDHERLESNCVDEIAAEIGDRREGTGLEPAKLVLKKKYGKNMILCLASRSQCSSTCL